jgi:ubiquinone/menaquinone biosynthesis C-methylase UbiE
MLYFANINTGNYKWFSRVYDGLASLGVPLGVWRRSHQELIQHLPLSGVVWVIGTGTGTALKAIPKDLQIVSIDASIAMEQRARKTLRQHSVQFVKASMQELDMPELPRPDAIVFPYLLQLIEPVVWLDFDRKLQALKLPKPPNLYVLDFVNPPVQRFWQRLYIPVLLGFYAWASGQKVARLNDWFALLESAGYHTLKGRTWLQGLVEFRILEKK